MQVVITTPAESLLSRLLQSERFRDTYQFILEKKEAHTNLIVSFSEMKKEIKMIKQKE